MGNADHSAKLNAGILEFILKEYQRVLKNHTRKHLTLSEVL